MTASVYRTFIQALGKNWRTTFPLVTPVPIAFHRNMPTSSTFYAGTGATCMKHVFLVFFHSQKAWEMGSFTIDVVLSDRLGAPTPWRYDTVIPGPMGSVEQGIYRIGMFLQPRMDTWWRLVPNPEQAFHLAHAPSLIDHVALEVINNVNSHVSNLFAHLGVPTPKPARASA